MTFLRQNALSAAPTELVKHASIPIPLVSAKRALEVPKATFRRYLHTSEIRP